jgi:alkylated DNA repair dioxygenase AlkB
MDLFTTDTIINILPNDGVVNYHGKVFSQTDSDYYFNKLFNEIEWKNDEAFIYGKHIITKRKAAWYGDKSYDYTYSKSTKKALPWTVELLELKTKLENITETTYNSCLLNLYHTGEEGMAYHSDDEKALLKNASIASISFGAERKFYFKHKKTKQTLSIFLEHGSLLVMKGETQTNWLHRLPPTKKTIKPRINLTFRTIDEYKNTIVK